MTVLRPSLLSLCLACLLAVPAVAQMSPPPGVLHLPPKNAPPPPPEPVVMAQPAPVTPVEQVAPFDTPQTHPPLKAPPPDATPAKPQRKVAKLKPTPVIQAQPNVHAQRPSSAEAKPAPPPAVAAVAAPRPAAPVAEAEPAKGPVTGLAIPRWAALRSDEVNLRVGPGRQFPIDWQYHRRDLPVQIIDERDVWRKIQDQDGVTGWVHSATLIGRRGFAVKGIQATLRDAPSDTAEAVAYLKPGVVGHLRSCEAKAAWCEVQVGDHRGYLRRDQFYGAYPGEAVPN